MGSRSGGGIDRSVLEPERRRVVGGLDEDGPEYLHVLARARLDVLVQDVDPSLCYYHTTHQNQQTRTAGISDQNVRKQEQSADR